MKRAHCDGSSALKFCCSVAAALHAARFWQAGLRLSLLPFFFLVRDQILKAFYSDRFVLPLPPGHRFPMQKYRMLREAVSAALHDVVFEEAPATSDGVLALAHHPDYIQRVSGGMLSDSEQKAIGFPWSPEMVERSRRSAGATIAACRAAIVEGVGVNLAGGTHHAHANRGQGFCVFNDAAIAARLMQAERRASRVAIIDLDVHQGVGTQPFAPNSTTLAGSECCAITERHASTRRWLRSMTSRVVSGVQTSASTARAAAMHNGLPL